MRHVLAHCRSTVFKRLRISVTLLPFFQIVPSSDNLTHWQFIPSNISLMNRLNRSGARTEPCGYPMLFAKHVPFLPPIDINACLLVKKLLIHFHTLPVKPNFINLNIKPFLHTLLYAFSRSMESAAVCSFWLKPLKIFWVSRRSASVVPLNRLNLSCSSSNKPKCSTNP